MTRRCRANAVAWRPQLVPRPVKPWMSSSGLPAPRLRTSQRRPSTTMPLTAVPGPRPRRRRPRDGAPRCAPGRSGTRAPGRPAGRSTLPARRGSMPGADLAVLAAERGHDRPDVDAVGRAEELLVVLGQADLGGVGGGLRQEREDPAAVVVDQDDRRRQAVQPGGHERVQVVQERHVADDQDDRPDPGRRRSERGRHDAVDPVRAAVGQRPDRSLAAGQPVVQIAHRHAVPGPQQRPVGQGRAESGERQALERLVAGLHRREPRRQRRVGGPIGVEPAGSSRRPTRRGRPGGLPRRNPPARRPWSRRRRGRTWSAGWPGRSSRRHHPRRSGSAPRRSASSARAWTSGSPRTGSRARAGARRARPRADQVVAVADDVRPVVRPATNAATAGPRGSDSPSRQRAGRARRAGPDRPADRPGSGRARWTTGGPRARLTSDADSSARPRDDVGERPRGRGLSGRPRLRRSDSIGPSAADGTSGSRNPMLRWTGPAGRPWATATARPTTDRACRRVSGAPSRGGSSANQRT